MNSGGGNNTFKVASATLGNVTINGGTKGTNTLSVTGGGTATMGAGITGITTVQLASATTFTANATTGLTIVGSAGADKHHRWRRGPGADRRRRRQHADRLQCRK